MTLAVSAKACNKAWDTHFHPKAWNAKAWDTHFHLILILRIPSKSKANKACVP